MSNVPNQFGQQQQQQLQVRYDETQAKYANQVLLNTTAEEVYLDFSAGLVSGGNGAVLPIHSRIVMTPNGVLRLYQALGQALQNYQIVQSQPAPQAPAPSIEAGSASEGGSESAS